MSRVEELEQSAAMWVLRREEAHWSAADEKELGEWLAQSDAHKAAYWRLEHGWRQADRIGSLGGGAIPLAEAEPRDRGHWWSPLALAASLALVFLLTLQFIDFPRARPDVQEARFETTIGSRKTVRLPDGSRVELNTNSLVAAALDAGRRRIRLDRGEAFFDVKTDSARAFVVSAGSRQVTVMGTQFSVRRRGEDLVVSVLEGRVRIEDQSHGASNRSAVLTAGDIATASGPILTVTSGSVEVVQQLLAWRSGMLVFNDTTLAEAAEQFNRYNHKQLVIADPKAGRTRIGGRFRASEVEAFARLLNEAYGLEVAADKDRITISG